MCDVYNMDETGLFYRSLPDKSLTVNSLATRGPGPGPYIDHVLYEGPRAGALCFGENLLTCRHGNTFCSLH